jgi:hypothetical protein
MIMIQKPCFDIAGNVFLERTIPRTAGPAKVFLISAMLNKKVRHETIAFVLFFMNCIGCGHSNSQEKAIAFPTWWLNRRSGSAQECARLSLPHIRISFCFCMQVVNLRKPAFDNGLSSQHTSHYTRSNESCDIGVAPHKSIDYSKWDKIMAPPMEEIGKAEWQELLNLTAELRAEGDYDALEDLMTRLKWRLRIRSNANAQECCHNI